jgi:hypothetical protein
MNTKRGARKRGFTVFSRAWRDAGDYRPGMQDQDKRKSSNAAELGPQDLIEFHLRWREFRPIALAICANGALSPEEQDIVRWLVVMADRIGRKDITEGELP